MTSVLARVAEERVRQDQMWGKQNHEWVLGEAEDAVDYYMNGWTNADQIKELVMHMDALNHLDYAAILAEEFAEALEAHLPELQVEELIQVAAVAIAAAEAIERNR